MKTKFTFFLFHSSVFSLLLSNAGTHFSKGKSPFGDLGVFPILVAE